MSPVYPLEAQPRFWRCHEKQEWKITISKSICRKFLIKPRQLRLPNRGLTNSPHIKFEYLSVWMSCSWKVRELVRQQYTYFRAAGFSLLSLQGYIHLVICSQRRSEAMRHANAATWPSTAKVGMDTLPLLTNNPAGASYITVL